MEFEWDIEKAESNLSKHGVSFDEAKTVWEDTMYIDFYDPDHSFDEHRFLAVGESDQKRLLIVSFTERDEKIRLISARELTPKERREYEQFGFE